jgi:cytochrome P450
MRPLPVLDWCRSRYGAQFTLYPVDMPPLVFLSKQRDIRSIVTAAPDTLHPGAGAAMLAPVVGESSFMLLDEEDHLPGRRVASRGFRRDALRAHAHLVADLVEREIHAWPCGVPFPLHPRLRSLTLKVAMRSVFGDETPELEELHVAILQMLSITGGPTLIAPRLRHLPGWRARWKRFLMQRREVQQRFLAAIAYARHADARSEGILDLLLQAHNPDGAPMSDQQIQAHVMSVLLAGHETTAAQLAWAFQLLAHSPHVQSRLIDEIDAASESREYLSATVSEVLRHRPVFLFTIPREVVAPIQVGEWTYKPPAQLLGCIYLMHHDPELYPNPHSFSPERFLNGPPQAETWLPWGGGRKRCPGSHLATLEMETVLKATLSARTVSPASSAHMEHARWRSVIVTPHAGSRVTLHKRHA